MASKNIGTLTVQVNTVTKYRAVFFPVATKESFGDVSLTNVLGFASYERAGSAKALYIFGLCIWMSVPGHKKLFGLSL